MTNKQEYLEWQLGVANEEQDRKLIKSIIKDLEVLELLKSKIGLNYIPTQVGIKQEKYILTGVEITKQEYEKIKEWLNGKREV